MTVTKVQSGKYRGQWKVRIQPRDKNTGNKINIPVEYKSSKREATELERKLWADVENGLTYRDGNKVFAESFETYVESQHESGRWGPGTYKDWKYSCQVFYEYFKGAKIKNFNEALVKSFARKYVKDHNVSARRDSVIDRRLAHMRNFFVELVGESIRKNPVPVRAIDKFFRNDEKSVKNIWYVLSNDEICNLRALIYSDLKHADVTKWVSRMAILVDLETGMRPQELQGVKWSDLTVEEEYNVFNIDNAWNERENKLNGHLKARKKGESRNTLPISKELMGYLADYHAKQTQFLYDKSIENHNDFIFLNLNDYRVCSLGYPVKQASLNEMLKGLGKKIGIVNIDKNVRWSMYSLRHTVATKLGNTPNMSYPWAAARMGHTLEEFMETYVHVDRDVSRTMLKNWKI